MNFWFISSSFNYCEKKLQTTFDQNMRGLKFKSKQLQSKYFSTQWKSFFEFFTQKQFGTATVFPTNFHDPMHLYLLMAGELGKLRHFRPFSRFDDEFPIVSLLFGFLFTFLNFPQEFLDIFEFWKKKFLQKDFLHFFALNSFSFFTFHRITMCIMSFLSFSSRIWKDEKI